MEYRVVIDCKEIFPSNKCPLPEEMVPLIADQINMDHVTSIIPLSGYWNKGVYVVVTTNELEFKGLLETPLDFDVPGYGKRRVFFKTYRPRGRRQADQNAVNDEDDDDEGNSAKRKAPRKEGTLLTFLSCITGPLRQIPK